MPSIKLHMHQIRDFISNRYSFYNRYYNNINPKHYNYKGTKIAFEIGTVIDEAIKNYHLGKEKPFEDLRGLNNQNRAVCFAMVNNYIKTYKNKEVLHNFKVPQFTIPLKKIRGCKYGYTILASPDLICENYHYNQTVILEIKTGETYEALDFQTMLYCWASWRWNFKTPAYVLKRTLKKPRIKQKKTESIQDYMLRLAEYDFKIDKQYRSVTREMCQSFEKKLFFILKDIDDCFKNPQKFYKQTGDYWG